jgi:hypothetical protein
MSDFDFNINSKKVRFLDKDLIKSLKDYAELKSNKYFPYKEFDKWEGKIVSADTIIRRFGSWKEALLTIGIEGGRERKFTPEVLIKNLENIWKELNHPPTRRQINKYGMKISERPYRSIWGGVKTACEQLALFHKGEITKEQLLLKSNTMNGCYVYLMIDTANEHYKIGISNNPEYRERTLQSEKPTIQHIAAKKFPNREIALSTEKTLHNKYAHKRKRGEWFQLDSKEVDEIKRKLK